MGSVSVGGHSAGTRRKQAMCVLGCRQLVEVVTDYLENSLDDDVLMDTREHLARCAHCRLYLGQMQMVITALGALVGENLERTQRLG